MLRTANHRRLIIAKNVPISQLLLGESKNKPSIASTPPLISSSRYIHFSGRFSNSNGWPKGNNNNNNNKNNNNNNNPNSNSNSNSSSSQPASPNPQQREWGSGPAPPLPGRGTGVYNVPYQKQFASSQHAPPLISGVKPPEQKNGEMSRPGFRQMEHTLRPYTPIDQVQTSQSKRNSQLNALLEEAAGTQPHRTPSKNTKAYGAPRADGMQNRPGPPQPQYGAPPSQPPGFPQFTAPSSIQRNFSAPPLIQPQYQKQQPVPRQHPPPPPIPGQYVHRDVGQAPGTQPPQGQPARFAPLISPGQPGRTGPQPSYGQPGIPPQPVSPYGAQRPNSTTNSFNRPEQQLQYGAPPLIQSQYGAHKLSSQPHNAWSPQPKPQGDAPPLIPQVGTPRNPFNAQPPQREPAVPRWAAPQYDGQSITPSHQAPIQQPAQGQSQGPKKNTQRAPYPSFSAQWAEPNRGVQQPKPDHTWNTPTGDATPSQQSTAQQPSQIYPGTAQYDTRPASTPHRFAVQQPQHGQQGALPFSNRAASQQPLQGPEVQSSFSGQYDARPASTPPRPAMQQPPRNIQGQSNDPPSMAEQLGARPAATPHKFAVQQPSQGQFQAPSSIAEQYGARPASTPHRFSVQQPPSAVPPSLAEQYGARSASAPHRFAVQQPFQQPFQPKGPSISQQSNARHSWLIPQTTESGESQTTQQYASPQQNYRFSRPQQASEPENPQSGQYYGRGIQRQGQQGNYNNGTQQYRGGDQRQSRYQQRDDYNNSTYSKQDNFQTDTRQRSSQKDSQNLIEQEPGKLDTRKKKATASKDKDKRAAAFAASESFLIDDDAAAQEAKLAKKKAKREKPVPILLPQFISVSLLANTLKIPLDRFLEKLIELGFSEVGHNHVLSAEDAGLIAMEYNFDPIVDTSETDDLKPRPWPPSAEDKEHLPPRPPVVTIMGHVDHGKTTLLDYLRKSSVAANEHGGITQHIGAFSVQMSTGKTVTFLDTPGHAAFLSMRERGANVTDIVILVVAADDSVMPQTIEAIKHAKNAGVPMIVAVNKCDKESADVDKVKVDLARNDVEIEDYGGETQVIPVSGKTGLGIPDLEEAILALADMIDMRAENDGPAEGWILEAATKKRGRVATVLVRRGTLKPGDIIIAGTTWARVRTLLNEAGVEVDSALPGTPVEVDGWKDQPEAGDLAIQTYTEEKAKSVVEFRQTRAERLKQMTDMEAINESRRLLREKDEAEKLAAAAAETAKAEGTDSASANIEASREVTSPVTESKCQEVNFIVRADVSGSVEAVNNAILAIGNNEVRARIVRSSFGAVSESDVDHASAAGATILAFNLSPDPQILSYARAKSVPIINSTIIYRLVETVTDLLSSKLPPKITHKITGEADILQVFAFKIKSSSPGGGKKTVPFAGCRVKTGALTKGSKVKIRRGGGKDGESGQVIWEGTLGSLKNVKLDVNEMRQGTECGVGFDGFGGFMVGDVIQCYTEIVEKRILR